MQSTFCTEFFKSVNELYNTKQYCDLILLARESKSCLQLKPIHCHTIVFCSVSPIIGSYLNDPATECELGQRTVLIPDMDFDELKKFIDDVYTGLLSKDLDMKISVELSKVLGMIKEISEVDAQQLTALISPADVQVEVAAEDEIHILEDQDDEVKVVEHPPPIIDVRSLLAQQQPIEPPEPRADISKKRPAAKRKNTGCFANAPPPTRPSAFTVAIVEAAKRSAVVAAQNNAAPNPDPNLKPASASTKTFSGDLDSLKRGFVRYNCVFCAKTSAYYTSTNVVADPANTATIDGVERQFRFKMPEKDFVAIVAVGIRNLENVVTTVSIIDPTYQSHRTFTNIFEMLKNICGISFGEILRHPRCSEKLESKLSRESIERFKNHYKWMSAEERSSICRQQEHHLKELDTSVAKIQLKPLPQKPILFKFNLVTDLSREEILDYAILSGNDPNELTIQSLFNFQYQKIPTSRIITIVCDMLTCFLGLPKSSSLSDYGLLKAAFENYATRTSQLLAIRELGAKNANANATFLEPGRKAVPSPGRKRKAPVAAQVVDDDDDDEDNFVDQVRLPAKRGRKKAQPEKSGEKDDGIERPFLCTYEGCNRRFIKEFALKFHEKRIHFGVETAKRSCPVCGSIQASQKALTRHIKMSHTERKCNDCGIICNNLMVFYAHRYDTHGDAVKCDHCQKSFKGKKRLRLHIINKHTPEHKKPYVCATCGKGFSEKVKLQSHEMSMHIRTRPYKCRFAGCTSDFNENTNRRTHEMTVHKFDYRKQDSASQQPVTS